MSFSWFDLLVLLLLAHFLADYTLQSDSMALGKNPLSPEHRIPWAYWLVGHAATHACCVYLITSNIWITLIEFGLHFLIDLGKCYKKFGIHTDQGLHLLSKIGYVILLGFL
jgi:hypothetical protein